MYYQPCAYRQAAGSRISILALAVLLTFSLFHQVNAQSFDRIEKERCQSMLKILKDEIKKNYYDSTYHGLDVETRFTAAEDKLKNSTSMGQAYGIIAQAVMDLNDSHTFFYPPARNIKVEYGWTMQMIGNDCFVNAVKPGSDAEAQGVKPGDQLISIEGFKPSRKDMWKMQYYYYGLSPRNGLHVVLQTPKGEKRELDLKAKVIQLKRVLDFAGAGASIDINEYFRNSEDEAKSQSHRFVKLGSAVVWKMPSFGFEPSQADSLMSDNVRGSSGLILDLRGNPGGYVATLERLLGLFFEQDLKIADRKGRKEMKPMKANGSGDKAYKGKVVVLVDSQSASAAELFARVMQLEKRGTVIGDRSSGSVMQSSSFSRDLGSGTAVYFAASITNADVLMSDGRSLEHDGVVPDELLLSKAEDMAALRDPVLARAAALLGVDLTPEKAGTFFPKEWPK